MSAPRNTLSIFKLNQSDCKPSEVIWTFITFPHVSLLSEMVSFHSHQHLQDLNNSCHLCYLCFCLFVKAQMCVCRVTAWEANEDIRGVQSSQGEAFKVRFIVMVSWNWLLFEWSGPMRVVRADRRRLVLTDWMSTSLHHFSLKAKRAEKSKEPRARISLQHCH